MNHSLSSRQTEILKFIQQNHHCRGCDVLNAPENQGHIQETQDLLQDLVAGKAVKLLSPAAGLLSSPLVLTPSGAAALSTKNDCTNQMAEEAANKKAEKKADRRFHLFNTLLGAIIGAIATLLIEHVLPPFFIFIIDTLLSFFLH